MVEVRDWVLEMPPISPQITCGEVYDIFCADMGLQCMPVVENGTPVGLADRNEILLQLADHFGRPLYSNKPITTLMDKGPLIIEGGASFDHLTQMILGSQPSALMRGFIVVEGEQYLGIGTAMQLMNMRLAHERKRAREFEVLRREAEEANIAKSTFLATMSHELRTPLNAIIGFSDLIMSEAFGPIRPARYVEYVKDICISGRHLLALVNDILDMAKIEAGEVDLDLQSISPDELCVVVMRILAPNTEKAGHEVVNLLPPLLPDLWVDERCGRQILMNLMSNAIKFTPSGGRIEVGGQREGDQVALWVRDNGIGIAAADIDKVMRPFGQVESALARQYQGTGLGLPLVAKMADAMGGSFTLASELGTGTTATVRFNVSQSAAPGLFAFG